MNVVFLIYRRPDLTQQVFAEIARARPERLLVVADGPRDAAEAELCARARAVVRRVDWPCDLRCNFAEANLGCRRRVASGLDWAFQQVEEAVILEDDCLPDPTFFRFCVELLERFRDEPRVGHIGGCNFSRRPARTPYSYYFSRYLTIWGWATWRRAWQSYDVAMSHWPEVKRQGRHRALFATREEADFFEQNWDDIATGRIDTWDGQWFFTQLIEGRLSVFPSVNLVTNLGFRSDGSHARHAGRRSYAAVPAGPLTFPLRHPPVLAPDQAADREFARLVFPLRRPVWQRAYWTLTNRHRYGALIRRLPLVGSWWARWRERLRAREGKAHG